MCGKDNHSSEAVYGLGLIGAFIFYVQQGSGFLNVLVSILKAIVWPAFMAYDLLSFLH